MGELADLVKREGFVRYVASDGAVWHLTYVGECYLSEWNKHREQDMLDMPATDGQPEG